MQDLYQNYVSDLNQLRAAFHDELAATAGELSKAMDIYAERSEAALEIVYGEGFSSWRGARSGGGSEARSVSRSSCKWRSAGCR